MSTIQGVIADKIKSFINIGKREKYPMMYRRNKEGLWKEDVDYYARKERLEKALKNKINK